MRCGVGLRGFGLKGVCRNNAQEHPLRREPISRGDVQLVEHAEQATCTGMPSIWKNRAHGIWTNAASSDRSAMVDAGDGVDHGGRDAGEGQVVTSNAGDGVSSYEPCTDRGGALHVVLGNRIADLDDPDLDPFALLEEEE